VIDTQDADYPRLTLGNPITRHPGPGGAFRADAEPGSSKNVPQAQDTVSSTVFCWIPDSRRGANGFREDDRNALSRLDSSTEGRDLRGLAVTLEATIAGSIFQGPIPALMTPCTKARQPDFDALVAKAQELIKAGMSAVEHYATTQPRLFKAWYAKWATTDA
jgi:hypothetical protein